MAAILPGSRVVHRADAPGYALRHLRHFGALLSIWVALFLWVPTSVSAQDEGGDAAEAVEVEAAEEQEVVALQALPVVPAVQVRGKDAPVEFLKPLINSEISFIKRVCEPSEEQMTTIVAAATKAYEATGDMIRAPNQPRVADNQVRIMGPGNEQLDENPYHRIRRDAAKYLQPLVSKEQYDRYQTESKQRDEFERGAVVGMIIGLIDDKIAMTEQQRAEMTELMMHEDGGLDLQSMQVYMYNPQYVPKLPVKVANKVFDKKQLTAWKSLNSVQMSFSTSFNNGQELSFDEEWIQ